MGKNEKKYVILLTVFALVIGMSGCLSGKKADDLQEDLLAERTWDEGYREVQAVTEEPEVTTYEDENDTQTVESKVEAKVRAVCEAVRAMDFTVREPKLDITPEENQVYLEGYLKVLKNEISIIRKIPGSSETWEEYYKDLWKAGIEFEELLKEKGTREYPYLYYYDDLDGDGKPELAIVQGCMYLLKYDADRDQCYVLYYEQECYFEKIVGAGQIWWHDGLYATPSGSLIRDRLVILTEDGSFQEVLYLEQGLGDYPYFTAGLNDGSLSSVMVSEENWNEVTEPFFEMVENNGLPLKTLEEVFGDLLEENTGGQAEPIEDDAEGLLSDSGEGTVIENDKYFKIIDTGEGRYLYTIYNTDGQAVKNEETYRMAPGIHYIDQRTIEIYISAGTNTFYCVYYDIVNDRFSEQYACPVAAKYNKVAFFDHPGGETGLIIKDMFNDGNYYKEYNLDISLAVSPVVYVVFVDGDTLLITYQSGDSYENKTKVLCCGKGGGTDDFGKIPVYETVSAMDFSVKEPHLDITPEENQMYLEGYLKVLRNEIPVISEAGEQYYKDLWKAGIEFEELLKEKGTREYPYFYYYDDLDGDGKPELAVNQGCIYLLKYEEDLDQCRILYDLPSYHFEKIAGTGQIWYHDELYGEDRLISITDEGRFQEVLWLADLGTEAYPYFVVGVKDDLFHYADVSEEQWNEITKPFFEAVENNGLPLKTLEEVFGDLLEENTGE